MNLRASRRVSFDTLLGCIELCNPYPLRGQGSANFWPKVELVKTQLSNNQIGFARCPFLYMHILRYAFPIPQQRSAKRRSGKTYDRRPRPAGRIHDASCDKLTTKLQQPLANNALKTTQSVKMPSSKGKPTDPKLREEIKESQSSLRTK